MSSLHCYIVSFLFFALSLGILLFIGSVLVNHIKNNDLLSILDKSVIIIGLIALFICSVKIFSISMIYLTIA